MHILATGFEPFGSDRFNASAAAVLALPATLDGHRISTAVLPVSFRRAGAELRALLQQLTPDLLVCVGEAGGRTAITPELFAANEDDARIPDNDGFQPGPAPIDPSGPRSVPATLDAAAVASAVRAAGYAAHESADAGRFVCNHVAYLAYRQPVPALFVHVPALRPQGQLATVGAETDPAAHQTGKRTGQYAGDRDPATLGPALAVVLAAAARQISPRDSRAR